MADTLFAGGPYFNVLARCATAITATSSDANFPVDGLTDYKVSRPWRANALASTVRLDADLNQITNPGFSTAFVSGLPASATRYVTWATSGATLTRDTTNHRTATGCLNVSGTDAVNYGQCELKVFAGEKLHIGAWGKRLGASGTAAVYVVNLNTRSYMAVSSGIGSWTATPTAALTNATTTYEQLDCDVTVESATSTMPQEMTLRFFFYASGSGANAAVYDDFYVWPNELTFTSMHGHNVSQGVTVQILVANSAPADTNRATLFPRLPSCYAIPHTTILQRFVSLVFTNAELNERGPIFIGEWVLCQPLTLARRHNYSPVTDFMDPHLRNPAGTKAFVSIEEGGQRVLHLPFSYTSLAQFQEARDKLIKATRNGAYPCVVVPDNTDAEVVVFGRLSESWSVTQQFLTYWQAGGLVVVEEPMPGDL